MIDMVQLEHIYIFNRFGYNTGTQASTVHEDSADGGSGKEAVVLLLLIPAKKENAIMWEPFKAV